MHYFSVQFLYIPARMIFFCMMIFFCTALPADSSPRVAILREEGSNGDREMAAAFRLAGFSVWDVNMSDLLHGTITLDAFRGLAFVGGFSFGDVLGSAKGWASAILFNTRVKAQFDAFFAREDTFSLGVCNGCQLMAYLGWVTAPGSVDVIGGSRVRLVQNNSGRFESRFCSVRIEPNTNSVFLKNMEDSVLGVWVSHGEGKFQCSADADLCDSVAMRYVDFSGIATTSYPCNPNGSPEGIAGLGSTNGRHLALMPHPERCFLMWQWPYVGPFGDNKRGRNGPSPWACLFKNAFDFCCSKE